MRSDMPNRIYRGSHPPRLIDHVLAHPYELLIAAGGFLASLLMLLAELGAPVRISPTMESLLPAVSWLVGITGITGGLLIVAGLLDDSEDLTHGWLLERLGLIGAIISWGSYALAVGATHPGSMISWGLPLCIAVGHGIRLAATLHEEVVTQTAIERSSEGL